jgi:hypothetical protein
MQALKVLSLVGSAKSKIQGLKDTIPKPKDETEEDGQTEKKEEQKPAAAEAAPASVDPPAAAAAPDAAAADVGKAPDVGDQGAGVTPTAAEAAPPPAAAAAAADVTQVDVALVAADAALLAEAGRADDDTTAADTGPTVHRMRFEARSLQIRQFRARGGDKSGRAFLRLTLGGDYKEVDLRSKCAGARCASPVRG